MRRPRRVRSAAGAPPLQSNLRRLRRVVPLLGIALAAGGAARAQPAPPPVTGLPEEFAPALEPLLKAAVTRSPDTILRSIEVDKAEARVFQSGTPARWPTLGGSARYAVNDESVSGRNGTSNRSQGFFYDVYFNQPLYQWGALKAQEEQWKIGVKIEERRYAEAMRGVAVLLRRSFVDLVVRKADLKARRYQLTLDEAAVAHEQERLKAGAATGGDVAGAELTVKTRKWELAMTQSSYDFAKRSVLRMAGVNELAEDAIPDELPRPKPDDALSERLLRGFTQGGVLNSFPVQADEYAIRQSAESYVVARHRLHPKFSVFAGYNVRSETQATANSIEQVAVDSTNYGVRADWNLFDGWATKGDKLAALASKRGYERQKEIHVTAATDMARTQHEQLKLSAQGLDLAEDRLTGARTTLKRAQDELAAGRAAQLDVDRAKLAVLQAEAMILPTRADYFNRWAEFVSLVGADPAMNHLPARYVR